MTQRLTRGELLERVRHIMLELFEVAPERVHPDATLIKDLGLDSIDALDLAARLEELTHQQLSEETLRSVRTIENVLTVIEEMMEKMPEAPETAESMQALEREL